MKFNHEGYQVEVKGELLSYFTDAKFLRSSLRMIPFSEDNLDTAKRLENSSKLQT